MIAIAPVHKSWCKSRNWETGAECDCFASVQEGGNKPGHVLMIEKTDWMDLAQRNNLFFQDGLDRSFSRMTFYDNEKLFFMMALGGECGELQNLAKKFWRGDYASLEELKPVIEKELADIETYTRHLARVFRIDLERACAAKAVEVAKRIDKMKEEGKRP